MRDLLRIHVIFDPASAEGKRVAAMLLSHFNGEGIMRDGVGRRVRVRFWSEDWKPGTGPKPIDFDSADYNVVVLLHDDFVYERKTVWNAYLSAMTAELDQPRNRYLPFASPTREPPLSVDAARDIQYARRDPPSPTPSTGDGRLLLHCLVAIRRLLKGKSDDQVVDEPLFISHAKQDGNEAAKAIVEYLNAPTQDVRLRTFYDAKELIPGDDFGAAFRKEIERGTLLALVSDIYDSRPWCIFEITTAKRAGRPVVLGDLGRVRTDRTYPYGANLPRVRVHESAGAEEWVVPLLVATLSEGLRCHLVVEEGNRRVAAASLKNALVLPRPPELFDLVERCHGIEAIVYPDPPLGRLEAEILSNALSRIASAAKLYTHAEVA